MLSPVANALYETGQFIARHDPLRFPGASAIPVKIPKTTPPLPLTDDVKIEKMDFSCIEERQRLSIADTFRQIGKTLINPINELAMESQVIHFYNNYHQYPSNDDINHLFFSKTSVVDKVTSIIMGFNLAVRQFRLYKA
ncbi:hypothetical protein [Serratia marcescens]|uniref:hypothetical protein n=1 Tax=Serratia marcescens TaxID=615 RepID=UPI00148CCAED|nr:hypothetical protein [Serratia marcescens]QJU42295.1 hypothetical protein HMI62_24615 [Serratia marcescens]